MDFGFRYWERAVHSYVIVWLMDGRTIAGTFQGPLDSIEAMQHA